MEEIERVGQRMSAYVYNIVIDIASATDGQREWVFDCVSGTTFNNTTRCVGTD